VPRKLSKTPRTRFLGLFLTPLVLASGAWLSLGHFDREGQRFYAQGKEIVETLDRLSAALKARDFHAAEGFYSPSFHGSPLGLVSLRKVETRDGIESLRFGPRGGELDRGGALAEWQAYLAGLPSIDELGLHVHRLPSWDGDDLEAVVRFELIGTPRGAGRPGIDRALFRVHFERAPQGLLIRDAALVEGERLAADRPQFVNVAHAAGVDFSNRYYPPFLDQPLKFGMIRHGPGGISAVDFDDDGLYDLFIPDGVESRLFHNEGNGRFMDVTEEAGLAGLDGVSVGVFADYDNDGWKDLFVSRTFQPNQLFHNEGPDARGHVHFREVTAQSGIGADCCTTVASWGDYDNDGKLDLYVGRYLDPRKAIPTTFYARNGEPNRLYHNDGGGHFTDVTEQAGVGDTGLCLGTAWGDYDGDGRPDLFVVNDFGRSTLYHNDGDGTFSDVTVKAGALAYGAGMSASFADYDNDGRLDLYTADIRSEHGWFAEAPTVMRYMANSWRQGVWATDMPLYFQIFRQSGFGFVPVFQEMASGNHLLHNRGDGTFQDVSRQAGANPVGWFWGSVFADFDNDGWQDLYSADGWVYNDRGTEIELSFLNNVVGSQSEYKTGAFFDPKHFGRLSWHGWERNRHLRNDGPDASGKVTFREIGTPAGTDLLTNSRGVAVADFWNRGALDIAVAASADRHALLRNEVGSHRHWLEVELVGTRSNRDAVGARVTIRANGKQQLREVAAGDGYASQSSLRLHFGLGEAVRIDELTVRWPASKTVQQFRDVAADRIVQVTEGAGLVTRQQRAVAPVTEPPASTPVGMGGKARSTGGLE
jgi:enediyne biosynthesis protein E4